METLNAQMPELIEKHKAEVSAINDNAHQVVSKAHQVASHNRCPVTGLCKTSGSFEDLLKTHAFSSEQAPQKTMPQLLVFASFSMNRETLKDLAQGLKRAGGALVFRGLVNDSFKETAKAFQDLGEEALIDPTLFRTYGVTTVPAFILRQAEDNPGAHVVFDKISGNVTLGYALSQFAEKGEVKGAQELLAEFRRER